MGEKAWRRAGACGVAAAAVIAAATIATTGSAAGAATPQARATLMNQANEVIGEVVFKGHGAHTDQVEVHITAPGITGLGAYHGFHVHTIGECNPLPSGPSNRPFGSAGGHWNPGGPTIEHGDHIGDLPSVLITGGGETHMTFETDRFAVADLFDTDGSAVVLHLLPDNFNNVQDSLYTPLTPTAVADTALTGDAGGRYACGVVTAP